MDQTNSPFLNSIQESRPKGSFLFTALIIFAISCFNTLIYSIGEIGIETLIVFIIQYAITALMISGVVYAKRIYVPLIIGVVVSFTPSALLMLWAKSSPSVGESGLALYAMYFPVAIAVAFIIGFFARIINKSNKYHPLLAIMVVGLIVYIIAFGYSKLSPNQQQDTPQILEVR